MFATVPFHLLFFDFGYIAYFFVNLIISAHCVYYIYISA